MFAFKLRLVSLKNFKKVLQLKFLFDVYICLPKVYLRFHNHGMKFIFMTYFRR